MATRFELEAAATELAALDPVLEALVIRHGPPRFRRRPPPDGRFEALARSVAFQQLAGSAAAAIWARVLAAVDGPFTPEAVLEVGEAPLRAAGFSAAKAATVLDLASHIVRGELDLRTIGRCCDEEVIRRLIQVRGIGRWTAQMFLMFALHRLDVWPTGDYGVRVGYALAFGSVEPPSPAALESLGDRFRPYRSLVAWYCWREVEAARSAGPSAVTT
jgi:3-methyladenine DNA glycosylase/8-oxoguanine DNA glycosylase